MSISYLAGRPWSGISREERFYCARLFERASSKPAEFAAWIASTSGLHLPAEGGWDIGFEVCFYRDIMVSRGRSATDHFPIKRTFDLCLFHEHTILIVEAKVCERFKSKQMRDIASDFDLVPEAVGRDINVQCLALASSRYFGNHARHGNQRMLSLFHGRITWAQVGAFFDDPLLLRADQLYKPDSRSLRESRRQGEHAGSASKVENTGMVAQEKDH